MNWKRYLVILRHRKFEYTYKVSTWMYSTFRYLYPKYWIKLVIPTYISCLEETSDYVESISLTIERLYLADQLMQYLDCKLMKAKFRKSLKQEYVVVH